MHNFEISYGVASAEPALEEAQRQAQLGMSALEGVLANYAQARFVPLNVQVSAWLMAALAEMPHALVVVGHPDPRENARGGGRESPDEPGKSNGRPGNGIFTQGITLGEGENWITADADYVRANEDGNDLPILGNNLRPLLEIPTFFNLIEKSFLIPFLIE